MTAGPFAGALAREEDLRAIYGDPMQRALKKDVACLDDMCRRLIAASPMVFVASHSADGVTGDPALLARLTAVGKPPRTAIVVEAEEAYAHCPKAFVRSKLWDPATWPAAEHLPTPAEVTLAHSRDPDLSLEDVERQQRESLIYRLD